jgi:hypothetical protein
MKLIFNYIAVCLSLTSLNTLADGVAMTLTPTQIDQRWSSDSGLSSDGIKQAVLLGDPRKPGPYTIRLSFPADYELPPQSHPDEREVTVFPVSGLSRTAILLTPQNYRRCRLAAGTGSRPMCLFTF